MTKRILYKVFLLSIAFFISSIVFAYEPVPEISLYNLTKKPIHYFFTNRNRDTISGVLEPSESQAKIFDMIPPDKFLQFQVLN